MGQRAPYTLVGWTASTSLGVSVPTALSSPVLTLIGISPAWPTNVVYMFGTNQTNSFDTYVSLYVGPSGGQQLVIPNGAHGNANPLAFAETFYLNKPIPPNTEIWATAIYTGGSAGSINVSVGLGSSDFVRAQPIQFLGSSTPPGVNLTSGSADNTQGAWVELGTISGTTSRLRIHAAPASYTNSGILYIGIGSAPSAPSLSIPFNAESSYAWQFSLDFDFTGNPGDIISASLQTSLASQDCACFAHAY